MQAGGGPGLYQSGEYRIVWSLYQSDSLPLQARSVCSETDLVLGRLKAEKKDQEMNENILDMVDNPLRRQERKVRQINEEIRGKALMYAKKSDKVQDRFELSEGLNKR